MLLYVSVSLQFSERLSVNWNCWCCPLEHATAEGTRVLTYVRQPIVRWNRAAEERIVEHMLGTSKTNLSGTWARQGISSLLKLQRIGNCSQFQHPRVTGRSRDNPNVVLHLEPTWPWCLAVSLTCGAWQLSRHDPPNGLGPAAYAFFCESFKNTTPQSYV